MWLKKKENGFFNLHFLVTVTPGLENDPVDSWLNHFKLAPCVLRERIPNPNWPRQKKVGRHWLPQLRNSAIASLQLYRGFDMLSPVLSFSLPLGFTSFFLNKNCTSSAKMTTAGSPLEIVSFFSSNCYSRKGLRGLCGGSPRPHPGFRTKMLERESAVG